MYQQWLSCAWYFCQLKALGTHSCIPKHPFCCSSRSHGIGETHDFFQCSLRYTLTTLCHDQFLFPKDTVTSTSKIHQCTLTVGLVHYFVFNRLWNIGVSNTFWHNYAAPTQTWHYVLPKSHYFFKTRNFRKVRKMYFSSSGCTTMPTFTYIFQKVTYMLLLPFGKFQAKNSYYTNFRKCYESWIPITTLPLHIKKKKRVETYSQYF